MSSISLVTPAYWRDRERCALLCESVDRYLTSYVKHYLIVADEELPQFREFNGTRRVVVPSSHLLPFWLKPMPRYIQRKSQRYWWSLRARPVSDWHVAQFLKIAAVRDFPEERCCILDSDVVFFRRFDLSNLLRPRPAPLYQRCGAVSAGPSRHSAWVHSSHRLLGLGEPAFPATDFVGRVIVWDRRTVRAMTTRIEAITGAEWVEALCRVRDFSEYTLYGYFVQSSPRELAAHVTTSRGPCLTWGADALDRPRLERAFAANEDVAISAAAFSAASIDMIRSSLATVTDKQEEIA